MTSEKPEPTTRSVEHEIEIEAEPEAVWKALTDAEELVRWFPLDARVDQQAGGKAWFAFGELMEGEGTIDIWEPNRHFRVSYSHGDSAGDQAEGDSPPVLMATDYYIEGRGGKTVLRLVQSGFGRDADWDNLFEGTRRGWRFQLAGLRHYLERHRGAPRDPIFHFIPLPHLSLEEGWSRIIRAFGFSGDPELARLESGTRFDVTTATGDRFEGTVQWVEPPLDFVASIENLNGAFMRIQFDPPMMPGGQNMFYVLVSTYGVAAPEVEALRGRLGELITATVAPPAA